MIDGSQFLKEVKNRDPHLGLLLEQMIDGINGTAQHLGVNPNGKLDPPAPLQDFQVNAGDGQVHVQLTDASAVKKNVQYFVEYSKDPSFATSYVEHLGASRNRVIALPAMDQASNPHTFYFKAYSQYLGSDAQSNHAVFGGKYTPTGVSVTGNTKLDLLDTRGAGTAFPNGSQSGYGLGTVLERELPGPKRSPAPSTK